MEEIALECMAPPSTNTFGIPNEPELLLEYELYKASENTKRLPSECHRVVFTEEFIENEKRGTLADLCVRALAKLGTRNIPALVKEDPLKLRIQYDSLDVNLPLKDCYFVEDMRFWRRVVLAKSSDKSLPFKRIDEYDWKGVGISLKYVELVEACPAAYWPEEQMAELGVLVSKYVKSLHIRHLQSLTDNSFAHYVNSEPELEATSEESEELTVSSDETGTTSENMQSQMEERESTYDIEVIPVRKDSSVRISAKGHEVYEVDLNSSISDMRRKTEMAMKRRETRTARNEARQQLRDMQLAKRIEHDQRRQSRAVMRKLPETAPSLKKQRKKKIVDVFNIVVPPELDDGEDQIPDKRNKDKLMSRIKRYDYPARHCHHIDLRFVRYFDMLNSLTLEFLGPEMNREYHKRHMNFSYDDMVHLSKGVSQLKKLKIFRLRNSRMDHLKLLILARTLKHMDSLEVVDFGYDQLHDDCSVALELLLERKIMLKRLELEYNKLGSATLESIGYALRCQADKDPTASPLEYLGLAHNQIGDYFINSLLQSIIGTQHVLELNLNGVQVDSHMVVRDVSLILRNHPPLRSLSIAAIPLNPLECRELLCSLESNHNVTHFDCRGCDMDEEYEYEADVIVRRNNYEKAMRSFSSSLLSEGNMEEYLDHKRHPVVKKIDLEYSRLAECRRNRMSIVTSCESSVTEEQQEEVQEQEFDIWKALGVQTSVHQQEMPNESIDNTKSTSEDSFSYDPNTFDLDQVREYMQRPGPGDRYYFFQRQSGLLQSDEEL